MSPKELDFHKLLIAYKDIIWRVNYSNQLKTPAPRCLRAFIGPGNNSKLIKAVLRKRWWWTFADDYDSSVNFVWTQIKVE